MKNLKLKSDKYRKHREGYLRFLNVYYDHCEHEVLVYQKDGPGELKRLYFDRISFPENLTLLQHLPIKKVPNLICLKCKSVLGIAYIYPKEKRVEFRLFAGAIRKNTTKIQNSSLNGK
ncbi:MAG: hypothetical protein A3C06_03840 [Candidatus Taylorbacteria bacterium RIFCSPHIGHO2_02_FULL_46_13]|uniref:Uncharacterized protein n=1 Tax=Candidatus Taylorbacteria bacterium RIFCSPHIGHO2_02_FULL_46_13 TaxID=1802312 RepID=A0A1G2MTF3_9BACT|nr:MAG: hypothetical protein A3C06_03840 [Candidatus Taylorbacteria bacterium RIFCSPHIGHO2_02_FULL_46_13]